MKPFQITEADYEDACESSSGICLGCGEMRFGDTEPDAENYPCDSCGQNKVQGIENALIEGNIELIGDDE